MQHSSWHMGRTSRPGEAQVGAAVVSTFEGYVRRAARGPSIALTIPAVAPQAAVPTQCNDHHHHHHRLSCQVNTPAFVPAYPAGTFAYVIWETRINRGPIRSMNYTVSPHGIVYSTCVIERGMSQRVCQCFFFMRISSRPGGSGTEPRHLTRRGQCAFDKVSGGITSFRGRISASAMLFYRRFNFYNDTNRGNIG